MRSSTPLLMALLMLFYLSASSLEVHADNNASGICGTGQTCTINLNNVGYGNFTYPPPDVTSVVWTSTNRTLGFTATGDSGSIATANVTIPIGAVAHQSASYIKVYVKGVQLSSSQVIIKMNSTVFFTAFNITFASPVNAAISLGIVTGLTAFPIASLTLLTLLLSATLPFLRKKQHSSG